MYGTYIAIDPKGSHIREDCFKLVKKSRGYTLSIAFVDLATIYLGDIDPQRRIDDLRQLFQKATLTNRFAEIPDYSKTSSDYALSKHIYQPVYVVQFQLTKNFLIRKASLSVEQVRLDHVFDSEEVTEIVADEKHEDHDFFVSCITLARILKKQLLHEDTSSQYALLTTPTQKEVREWAGRHITRTLLDVANQYLQAHLHYSGVKHLFYDKKQHDIVMTDQLQRNLSYRFSRPIRDALSLGNQLVLYSVFHMNQQLNESDLEVISQLIKQKNE